MKNSSACLRVGAAVAGYDVDGGQDLRLGEIGVEVEVRRRVVAEAHQRHSRLSTDVHPVDETSRHPQRQLVVGLGASRHVEHQRQVHGTPAFCTHTHQDRHRRRLAAVLSDRSEPDFITRTALNAVHYM